jgi:hypothetical protein
MRAPEALTAAAITLRRALMRIDAGAWAANSTGCDYVQRLDALFNVEFFRHGPGEIFGEQLYRERPSSERVARAIDGLHELLRRYRP